MKTQKPLITAMLFGVLMTASCSTNPTCERNTAANDKHLTEPMYEMLGMLDEYISRKLSTEHFERFYPHETKQADRFESLLREHAKLTGLKQDWKREVITQGHIYFYSPRFKEIINSFYVEVDGIATLDASIFSNASKAEMTRYVQGAYARYGYKENPNVIGMANALYKTETIGGVLQKLGCSDILIYKTEGLIPMECQVVFTPGTRLQQQLDIKRIYTEKEMSVRQNWVLYKKLN